MSRVLRDGRVEGDLCLHRPVLFSPRRLSESRRVCGTPITFSSQVQLPESGLVTGSVDCNDSCC